MFKFIERVDKPLGENLLISVAGNVGAGKSTLTKLIGEKLGFEVQFEAVDDNPYLERFYEDQERWAFHSQLYFLSQRFKYHNKFTTNGLNNIQDRSIYEDVDIFAKNLYDNGKMSEDDYKMYTELFENMSAFSATPDLLIFLDGSIDSILQRINVRGREMEKHVEIEYWENLHNRYKEFLENYNKSNVLVVNIDKVDLLEGEGHLDMLVDEIKKALNL